MDNFPSKEQLMRSVDFTRSSDFDELDEWFQNNVVNINETTVSEVTHFDDILIENINRLSPATDAETGESNDHTQTAKASPVPLTHTTNDNAAHIKGNNTSRAHRLYMPTAFAN